MEDNFKKRQDLVKIIERPALILGFILDSAAIIKWLFSISYTDSNLSSFTSPGVGFILWIILTYIYFCYLNLHWKNKRNNKKYKKKYSDDFISFLTDDLLLDFCEPLLLLPGLITIIFLVLIVISADLLLLLIWALPVILSLYVKLSIRGKERIGFVAREKIDNKWDNLKYQILMLFDAKNVRWLCKDDIKLILIRQNIPFKEGVFWYIFQRLSSEEKDLKYGYIRNTQNKSLVTFEKVLASKSRLQENYMCIG
ncbi:MAG: hypothetical protein ACHWZW_00575 [Spirulina sp.]